MTENRNCEESLVEEAREFMCGYRLAADMLHLQRYERKRAKGFEEECACADILEGDEADWKARIQEVGKLLTGMKNGREKLLLYHHYVRGTSIERIADLIGVSRRTGYRIHRRALLRVGLLLKRSGYQGA